MARYLPNNGDTLNPRTLLPRVRCEPKLVVGPPRSRFWLGKENLRGVQTFFLIQARRWLRPSTQSHVFLACCVSEGEFNSRPALSNDEWLATSR